MHTIFLFLIKFTSSTKPFRILEVTAHRKCLQCSLLGLISQLLVRIIFILKTLILVSLVKSFFKSFEILDTISDFVLYILKNIIPAL